MLSSPVASRDVYDGFTIFITTNEPGARRRVYGQSSFRATGSFISSFCAHPCFGSSKEEAAALDDGHLEMYRRG